MTLQDVFVAVVLIGIVLLLGKLIRRKVRVFQRLYMPSSIIGGLVALLLGPQVLGAFIQRLWGEGALAAEGLWPQATLEVWSGFPGLLISVVFAGLFLGKTIPRVSEIWKQAGPMVAHGQTMAWGGSTLSASPSR